jgi:hypothetical protein
VSHSLIVKCYLCALEVNSSVCMGVSGLGPTKYVCPACVGVLVVSVVQEIHNEKNAASRRYLAKGRSGEQG